MRRQTAIVLCAIALMAAGSTFVPAAATAGASDRHSKAYIAQRIDTIYKYVGKLAYDEDGSRTDFNPYHINFDSAYCSERYYALMQQAEEIGECTGDIFYDYDHWVCGQDVSDDWHHKVKRVYDVTDSTALADLIIHNFSDREITIALRFERGDWYVDDFEPSPDGADEKAILRNFIEEGLKTCEQAKSFAGKWGWVGDSGPELLLTLEAADKGLKVVVCDVYRMYGFCDYGSPEQPTVTYNGEYLFVHFEEWDPKTGEEKRYVSLSLQPASNGDLKGDCTLKHPLGKDYNGPITLRRDYFKYGK